MKNKTKDKNDPSMFIFTQGKAVDFFVLILEGRVEVTVGKEGLIFEGGPFNHFGLQALVQTVGFESPLQQIVAPSQGVRGSLQSLNMENMLVSNSRILARLTTTTLRSSNNNSNVSANFIIKIAIHFRPRLFCESNHRCCLFNGEKNTLLNSKEGNIDGTITSPRRATTLRR